jgi:hypothetical protein
MFSHARILIGQGFIIYRYIFMAMYSFLPPSRESKFCGVLSCVFDKLGCAAGGKRLWNIDLDLLPYKISHAWIQWIVSYHQQITPSRRVLPEKLIVAQLVKKLPAFYGTRRFMTVLTGAHHLSYTEPDESSPRPTTPFL